MFKTRNLIAAVVATVALGSLGTTAFADDTPNQPPPAGHFHKGPHGGPEGGWMMFKGLNLTDAQKAQVKQLFEANRPAMEQQRQAMKASHDHEQALLFSSDYSDAKADQLAQANAQQAVAAHAARLKFQHQLYAVLTPAQQQQLQANIKAREAKWAQHRAEHGKPGDAPQQ